MSAPVVARAQFFTGEVNFKLTGHGVLLGHTRAELTWVALPLKLFRLNRK